MALAGTRKRGRRQASALAVLSASIAAFGVANPRKAAAQAYTYTGPSGTPAAPTSGSWSPAADWLGGVTPSQSTTTELDFLDTSSSGYTATDDITGGFLLTGIVLGNNTANTDTIAAISGSSISFSGTSPYITQSGTGAFVISAPIGIDPSDTLTFGGSGTGVTTVTGSIGGGAGNSVTVAGANTVVFTASNSYAGALNVNSGILNIQNSGAISGAQGYINSGATLQLQNNITESAPLQLQGSGAGGQNGALVNTSGTNTITGNITFAGGTTTISSDSGTLIFSGANFSDTNPLILTGSGNGVIAENSVSYPGGNGITKSGTGTWYLATANSWTGSLHLNSGTVNFVQGGLGTAFINPGGGILQYAANTATPADVSPRFGYGTGTAPVAVDTNGNNVTFASSLGSLNNNGGLTKYGSGTLTLTAAMGYGGTTSIVGGTLQVGNGTSGSLPGGSSVVISSGAALGVDSPNSTSMNNAISNAGTISGNQGSGITDTLSGNIGGAGVLTQSGSGSLILSGSNSYSGATTINSGTLAAGSTNAFSLTSAVTIANAADTALNITGYNNTIGSLAGGGTLGGNVVLGSSQLTIGSDNTNTTFAGAISGIGSISKTGSGTLTLTGSSSFSGGGNVSAGILNLQNSSALGTSTSNTFTVFAGATLQLQGGITLPGYTIQVADAGASTQDGAIVNAGGTNTISGPINVTGSMAQLTTISSDAGTLIVAGGITTGGNNFIISGSGNGIFANSGNVNFTNSNYVEKDGSGIWDFANGTASFAGNLHLVTGTVSFAGGGLGTTTINADGGVLKYDTGNTQDVSGVAGNPVIQYGGGSQYNYSPIAIDTNGNNVTFNGTLTNNNGSEGLIKYGAGALILNAATDYGANNTTVTDVLGGTLVVNGSTPGSAQGQYGSTVTVGNGISTLSGTLAGNGTIGAPLTVQYGGTITAGSGATSSDSVGTLALNGATFNSGGTYAVKIGASNTSDELITNSFTGPSSGTFVIQVTGTGSATFAANEQWVIADDTQAGSNPFNISNFVITSVNAPPASDFSLSSTPDSGSGFDLVLTENSVPEPTSILLLSPVAAGLFLRRRRRRMR
jgi:fibronectin-binding autotransporter adhesin